jgi:hypothetical protein
LDVIQQFGTAITGAEVGSSLLYLSDRQFITFSAVLVIARSGLYAVGEYVLAQILTSCYEVAVKIAREIHARIRRSASLKDVPRVLAVVNDGACRNALKAIFDDAGWIFRIVDSLSRAEPFESDQLFGVVLYERESKERSWTADVSRLADLSPRPWIVLLSGKADKNLWDELGRHGGSDILRTPFSREAVIRAVQAGWFLWRNQQRLR